MSIKKKTLGLAAAGVLMFTGTAFADNVNLRDILVNDGGDNWSVPGQSDGNHVEWVQSGSATLTGYNITLNNATVTVTIGPYDARTTLVQANSFALQSGALSVNGGTSGSVSNDYFGLNLKGAFTQSGGTSSLTGGTEGNTNGLGAGSVAITGGTMYAEGGTGADAYGAHGVSTTTFTVSGDSTIYAEGGGSELGASYGIYTSGNFTLNQGRIIASGAGDMDDSNVITYASSGIYVGGDFTQVNGNLEAHGGGVGPAFGLEIAGDFTQSGNGYAEIEGGGTNSYGAYVDGDFTQSGDGTIKVTSGNNRGAEGLVVMGVVRQTGSGSISAEGLQAAGIYTNAFYMSGTGTVTATAGHTASVTSYTDPVTGVITHTLTSIGVGISSNTFTISSGTLTATGGYPNAANSTAYTGLNIGFAGIESLTFNQSGGNVVAYGGLGTHYDASTAGTTDPMANTINNFSAGIYTYDYNHIGGTLTAYAGTETDASSLNAAQNSHGVVVLNDFTMSGTANAGQVTVYGAVLDGGESLTSAKQNSTGMWVGGDFSQTAAQSGFKAVGGNASGTYGLYVAGTAEINGTFAYENNGSTAAVHVANSNAAATAVTIGSTAVIAPVIDLRSTTVTAGADITGLLTSSGTISINSAATLRPLFKNSASLGLNETSESKVFMQSYGTGGIQGYFAGTNTSTGIATGVINLMFEYTAQKSASLDEYEIAITRVNTVDNALQGYVGENTMSLLQGLTAGLVGTYFDEDELVGTLAALNDFYTTLETLSTLEEMAAVATEAQKYLANHGSTRMAAYAIQQMDVVETMLNSEMTFAQKMPYWQVWAKGVYNYSDNVKAKTDEFVKGKDDFNGFVLGAARDFRYVTFGGQFHYLTGTVKSKNIYKAEPDTFGIIVGARIHDVVNPKGTFNPWFDINFAYSRMDADQHRVDLVGVHATSTVKSDIMRVSAAIGNTFKLGDMVTFTPQVGFDYTHISQKGYTERNSDLALKVDKTSFDSFRPKVGAEVDVALSDVISAQFRAFYRYEAGDNRMILDNRFAGAEFISFKTKGEKLSRSAGQLGVGFDVNFTETVSLGLDYDLWLRDQYTGHQFAVELRVGF